MTFAVGSLVRVRDREWVVLPESSDFLLMVRPLGGTEDEVTGIFLPLEHVEPAQFDLPSVDNLGDFRSCRLLRDAIRLGFRSSAGPFRSFARIAVEPRPYQLVPLLMALRHYPVRLLIADDVGIGKTIEACLVARELLDRGEACRLAVLCPPQLAEQWQRELKNKFHIDAELVLSSTARKLERNCTVGQSLFEVYPYVVVSMDFIKSEKRRDEFFRSCPELVIVDEAHTCAYGGSTRSSQHQRYMLIKGLVEDQERNIILVTATPHSGKEEAFRSLLGFLRPEFIDLPDDLTGKEHEHHRRKLSEFFVQRRRADIKHYLETDTPFPDREEGEDHYTLSPDYKAFFEKVLKYTREIVHAPFSNQHHQRVRWWSALALLRSLASSPAAAASTLRSRAATADTETTEEADEIGRRTVLDIEDLDVSEQVDIVHGGDIGEIVDDAQKNRRRLLDMAREAETLQGGKDYKLLKAVEVIKKIIADGYRPIVFCRFIPTAEYLAKEFRERLPRMTEVASVTGLLPPSEREERVKKLAEAEHPVLVCTDCLSEGINLQEYFDAAFHYDLSWNPTRHEQREGRVDRYGQPKKKVRVFTYYGIDNQIDGIVLDVLIRKHKTIKSSLGISVPVPVETNQVIDAIFEGLLLREETGAGIQQYLPGFDEYFKPQKDDLFAAWENVSEREKRSRTLFAQEGIQTAIESTIARELHDTFDTIGASDDVVTFTLEALQGHGAVIQKHDGCISFNLKETPRALRDLLGMPDTFKGRFEMPVQRGEVYISRTHPLIENLAAYVLDTALDIHGDGIAKRAGVMYTHHVKKRTTLLLLRYRFHIHTYRGEQSYPLLAEDSQILAFIGSPQNAVWIDDIDIETLISAQPDANITPEQARDFIRKVVDNFNDLRPHLDEEAHRRGELLLDAHRRVRQAAGIKGIRYAVEPKLPPDVLGIYVYLPVISGSVT